MTRTHRIKTHRRATLAPGLTAEDRAIFDTLAQSIETEYRFADRAEASTASRRLRGGGIVATLTEEAHR